MKPDTIFVLVAIFCIAVASIGFVRWWNARKAEKAADASTDTTPGGASSGLGGTKPK